MVDQINLLIGALVSVIPRLLGALVVLLIGYIVARVIRTALKAVLIKAGLDRMVSASPGGQLVKKATDSPSGVLGAVVFWIVFFGAISLAVSVLGISALTALVGSVYSYLPNVIAALLILLVAAVVSGAVSGLVSRVMGDTATGKMVAGIAPGLIFSVAIFMVLNQLQIAPAIVTLTYAAIIGSVALGAALAFGLGGREVAANMLQQAQSKAQEGMGQARQDLALGKERSQEMVADTQQTLQEDDELQVPRRYMPAAGFGEDMDSFKGSRDKE